MGIRGMEKKRRLHPRRRRQRLTLAYSEGGRLNSASSDSAECTEQENNTNNAFGKLRALTDSISSAFINARTAFGSALGSLSSKVGAMHYPKALSYPPPEKLTTSPPKLVVSISQDDDSTDESTSIISLSGVSSFEKRRDAKSSKFWSFSCVIIAALLAFAHVCFLPKGMYVPSNSFVQDPVAMEVPTRTVDETRSTQISMIHAHLPTAFLRDRPEYTFGVRSIKKFPAASSKEHISSIAKSRAEERLTKLHADALKNADLFVAVISEMQKNRGIEEIDMDVSDGVARPGMWRLLGSYFVPALMKAAGHH